MDIELLKKVALYTIPHLQTPTHIDGYSDEEVKEAVSELINKEVIICGSATKYSPMNGTYTVNEGNVIPTDKAEKISAATVFEHQFEKCYGEKLF